MLIKQQWKTCLKTQDLGKKIMNHNSVEGELDRHWRVMCTLLQACGLQESALTASMQQQPQGWLK